MGLPWPATESSLALMISLDGGHVFVVVFMGGIVFMGGVVFGDFVCGVVFAVVCGLFGEEAACTPGGRRPHFYQSKERRGEEVSLFFLWIVDRPCRSGSAREHRTVVVVVVPHLQLLLLSLLLSLVLTMTKAVKQQQRRYSWNDAAA